MYRQVHKIMTTVRDIEKNTANVLLLAKVFRPIVWSRVSKPVKIMSDLSHFMAHKPFIDILLISSVLISRRTFFCDLSVYVLRPHVNCVSLCPTAMTHTVCSQECDMSLLKTVFWPGVTSFIKMLVLVDTK